MDAGWRNCRSLGVARDDKGERDASIRIGHSISGALPPLRCTPVGMTILLHCRRCRDESSISKKFVIPTERSEGTCCKARLVNFLDLDDEVLEGVSLRQGQLVWDIGGYVDNVALLKLGFLTSNNGASMRAIVGAIERPALTVDGCRRCSQANVPTAARTMARPTLVHACIRARLARRLACLARSSAVASVSLRTQRLNSSPEFGQTDTLRYASKTVMRKAAEITADGSAKCTNARRETARITKN